MPKRINTFVFLNIGVTGLQEYYGRLSPVKVILKPISRMDLLTGQFDSEDIDFFDFEVIDERDYVPGQSLEQYNLSFNGCQYEDIMNYLQHLPKPMVLVAYGGSGFHFQILRKAMAEHGIIPSFIRCVDLKEVVYELETGKKPYPQGPWFDDLPSYKLANVYKRVTGNKYAFDMRGRGLPLENLEKITLTANFIASQFTKWADFNNHKSLFMYKYM